MNVGSIKCLFFKYYNNGRSPLLSIGPSWPFTIGLLMFALFALIYFLWLLTLLKIVDHRIKYIGLAIIFINLTALFMGILKNPGIP